MIIIQEKIEKIQELINYDREQLNKIQETYNNIIYSLNQLLDKLTLYIDLKCITINNKKSRDCLNKECTKEATYNYKNYKELGIRKCIYCKTHKLNNMINIKDKKCIKCEVKIPYFNYEYEIKALFCGDCKENDMVDVKSKKCIKCKNKQPSYNYKNKTKFLYCKDCKENDMVDIRSKKCIKCKAKQSNFNYENETKGLYCGDCKSDDMIDVIHPKCIFDNCKKISSCNYKDKKITLYCSIHKLKNMIDIVSTKCKTENCDTCISNIQYKGYCLICFIHENPGHKLIRDYGTQEHKVSEFIKKTFTDLDITYNKTIEGGCSLNRPDIFIDCLTHSVIIEVDEHQHKNKSYTPECEIQRINNLFTDLADRPIVFIRFNPDSYKNKKNKLIKSCFEYTEEKGIPKANKRSLTPRLNKLKEDSNGFAVVDLRRIEKNINLIPDDHITTIKLYYDGY